MERLYSLRSPDRFQCFLGIQPLAHRVLDAVEFRITVGSTTEQGINA
jgi:hypothetical protein